MPDFDQKWFDTSQMLKERFGKVPDMEGILFLIGLNEVGATQHDKFSKEQKQDLMHVAVCTLLSQVGYFEFAGRDEEGWPHFDAIERPDAVGIKEQERLLKECVIRYFAEI